MKVLSLVCSSVLILVASLFGQNNPAPSVIQLVPPSVKPGSGAFTLHVTGANFVSGSVLNWNGSPRATQVLSSDELTATITAGDVSKASTASLTVANPAPGGGVSSTAYFSVQVPTSALAFAPDPFIRESGVAAFGDFNGDGKLDLVIGRGCAGYQCSPQLDFYAGHGDGTFAAPVRTLISDRCGTGDETGFWAVSIFVADIDGDGKPDIAFNEWSEDPDDAYQSVIMINNGDGTFTHRGCTLDAVSAVGDLNGDGLPDLIAAGPGGSVGPNGEGSVWLASSDGTYKSTASFDFGNFSPNAVLGDFNGDGKLDLAFSGGEFGQIAVFLGNGDGTFQQEVDYRTANPVTQIAVGDLNGDGKLDLVTDGVCVLFGNGDGTFSDGPCTNSVQGVLVLGDLNTDGKPDVAILSTNPPSVTEYLGNGDGTFGSGQVYTLPTSPEYFNVKQNFSVSTLASGDLLNIGRAGFAVSGTPTAMVYSQTVASVTPTALAFGNEQVGKMSPPQTVIFQNIERAGLQIRGIRIARDASFQQTNNCNQNIAGGLSCQIQVTFTAQSSGAAAADLIIDFKGPAGRQTVPLSGTGVSAAAK